MRGTLQEGFTMAEEAALYVRFQLLWPARQQKETREHLRALLETMRWARGDGT